MRNLIIYLEKISAPFWGAPPPLKKNLFEVYFILFLFFFFLRYWLLRCLPSLEYIETRWHSGCGAHTKHQNTFENSIFPSENHDQVGAPGAQFGEYAAYAQRLCARHSGPGFVSNLWPSPVMSPLPPFPVILHLSYPIKHRQGQNNRKKEIMTWILKIVHRPRCEEFHVGVVFFLLN